jgi:hypothetical protein
LSFARGDVLDRGEDFFGAIAGYERVEGLLYRLKGSTAADG